MGTLGVRGLGTQQAGQNLHGGALALHAGGDRLVERPAKRSMPVRTFSDDYQRQSDSRPAGRSKSRPVLIRGDSYRWCFAGSGSGDLVGIQVKELPNGVSTMREEEVRSFINALVGREVEAELLTVDPWYSHELIADTYRSGRVFLAGDECHLHPPIGGYGHRRRCRPRLEARCGARKVGDRLLDSYTFERCRVAQWTIDEAVKNYSTLSHDLIRSDLEAGTADGSAARAALADEIIRGKQSESDTIGLVLRYHYGDSPVVVGGEDLPNPETEQYVPRGEPGALAPHL